MKPWLIAPLALFMTACIFGDDDDDAGRTRADFCNDWAAAACSEEVVDVCQAEDSDACRVSQEAFCLSLVPKTFSDARGDECLNAVKKAYADANLDAKELRTVRSLGEPCDQLVQGPTPEGEDCEEHADCDTSAGFECVKKAAAVSGTCEIPELAQPGDDCDAAQQVCTPGYFCNGENCISALDAGEACDNQEQCGDERFCNAEGECEERLAVDKPCSDDVQCLEGVCYDFDGDLVCTDRIVLSRSEPICRELR